MRCEDCDTPLELIAQVDDDETIERVMYCPQCDKEIVIIYVEVYREECDDA